MADEDHRRADAGDDIAYVGGVTGDTAQWVCSSDGVVTASLKLFDDRVPARGLGEGAVNENDGGSGL